MLPGAMSFRNRLLQEYDDEMNKTRKMLELVPDDKLGWKPHEKSMTLGRLASHVADFPTWGLSSLQTNEHRIPTDWRPEVPKSRQEILSKFEKDLATCRDEISRLQDSQLDDMWSLKFGDQTVFTMPRAQVIRGVVMDHMIHHRGQLSVYLRMLDVPIPGMYGPSADEMPQSR
jgi:uncharacterized damage-inducible protein DinB